MLQGGIEQQPVDQHRVVLLQTVWAGGDQLGGAAGRQFGSIAAHPVQADLANGTGRFHRLPPRPGCIHREPVAAGQQRLHRELCRGGRAADAQGRLLIQLHHQMGAQPQRAGIGQGPVAHPQLQGPGTIRQQAVVGGGHDLHARVASRQPFGELLDRRRRGHFL